jgi:hypothetical protein
MKSDTRAAPAQEDAICCTGVMGVAPDGSLEVMAPCNNELISITNRVSTIKLTFSHLSWPLYL